MKNYHFTAAEREIIIHFDDAGPLAEVSTRNKGWQQRMDKLAQRYPDVVKALQSSNSYAEYELPKSYVRVIMPPALSPDERERRRQNMKRIRKKSSNNATDHPAGIPVPPESPPCGEEKGQDSNKWIAH